MEVKKNPLSIALGIFLSEERRKFSDSSVKAVVRELNLGESFDSETTYSESLYRMVESGNARIHPKHLFEYIRVFNESSINVEPFCQLIIAIQFLDAYLGDSRKFNKAYTYLKQSGNTKYESLLEAIQPYLKYLDKNYSVIKEQMISGSVIKKLRQFLSMDTYEDFGKSHQEIQQLKIIRDVPTIYYSFIDNFVKSLLNLPIEIKGKSLWAWEAIQNIEYLFSISKDVKTIISKENFKNYKYKYVLSPNSDFKEAHLIFLTNENAHELKKNFCKLLKEALMRDRENDYLKDFDTKMENIFIYSLKINDELQKKIFSNTRLVDLGTDSDYYNAAWAFQLKDNNSVGFKGVIDRKTWMLTEALSLTWGETNDLIKEIKSLIESNI
jgi:hypothetical protein